MFILTTVSDLVQIDPEDFQKPSAESIRDNINAKYANKVIQKIGLCICLYDILSVQDGIIGYGTGKANVNVEFRLVVFRPFKGEIILGQISSASERGIKGILTSLFALLRDTIYSNAPLYTARNNSVTVRLDFFDDILVPPHLMLENSQFNVRECVWTWNNDGDEYFYDQSEWVRIRVEEEEWHDLSPVEPSQKASESVEERKSPYSITASMMQSGLGPVEWW